MLVISFVQWWYGRGFKEYLLKFFDHLKDIVDFFSIRLLIRNLFAPFRQIATEKRANMPLDARIRAWADLMISRMVGAAIRIILLIIGTIALVFRMIIGLIIMVAWPLAPLLIVYTILLYMRGVVF